MFLNAAGNIIRVITMAELPLFVIGVTSSRGAFSATLSSFDYDPINGELDGRSFSFLARGAFSRLEKQRQRADAMEEPPLFPLPRFWTGLPED